MLVIYPPYIDTEPEIPEEAAKPVEIKYAAKKESAVSSPGVKPSDWKYMEQSGEILKNPPKTWSVYPKTKEGLSAVIDMEYRELKGAEAGRPKEEIMRELVHLGTATLALWRLYNADE